jgi:hypothetical protein
MSAATFEDEPDANTLAAIESELVAAGFGARRTTDEHGASLRFVRGDTLLRATRAANQWLIDGLVPLDGVVALAGEPKTMKTWFALDIALSVAGATDALGAFATRVDGDVALVLTESTQRECQTRLAALLAGQNACTDVAERVHLASLAALDICNVHDAAFLVATLRRRCNQLSLLILDPLRNIHVVEENDNSAMALVMRAIRAVSVALRCAVLFIHHTSKSPEGKASTRRPGQRMRGASAIHAAVDGTIHLAHAGSSDDGGVRLDVDCETRNGRSAGRFVATLTIDDDDADIAATASWQTDVGASAVPPSAKKVLACLAAATDPLSMRAIERVTSVHKNTVKKVLIAATKQGLVRECKGGWIFVPPKNVPPPSAMGTGTPLRGVPDAHEVGTPNVHRAHNSASPHLVDDNALGTPCGPSSAHRAQSHRAVPPSFDEVPGPGEVARPSGSVLSLTPDRHECFEP